MPKKSLWIRIGDFFFKTRNYVFPIMWVALFAAFKPAPLAYEPLARDVVAFLIVVAGLALRGAVIGYAYIKRGGLNKQVYADQLVTEGFFTTCRNPLYVGNMLIYIGVFVMHGNLWVMLLGIGGSFAIYQAIIAAEEYFLRNKFGAQYEAYCAEVPRWRILTSRLKAATSGMSFNLKRVFLKDYSTIVNALVTLTFINLLKHYHYDTPEDFSAALKLHLIVMAALLVFAAGISMAKKKKLLTA